jgi:hypothetical protein
MTLATRTTTENIHDHLVGGVVDLVRTVRPLAKGTCPHARPDIITGSTCEREGKDPVDVVHDSPDEATGGLSRRLLGDPLVKIVELLLSFRRVVDAARP